MKLSARNQLNGKITNVEKGAVMANVKIEISEPLWLMLKLKSVNLVLLLL